MPILPAADRLKSLRKTKLYDLLAALPLISWFAFCGAHIIPLLTQQMLLVKLFIETDPTVLPTTLVLSLAAKVVYLLFLAVLIVFFAIRYIPRARASGVRPRMVALAGTFMGSAVIVLPPYELSTSLYIIALALIIIGFFVAIWATVCLGRSISMVPEVRKLVTGGPYCWVRHPLYFGEMTASAGIALQYTPPWAVLIWVLHCAFQVWRIHNEERLLLQAFPTYAAYASRTARLVPRIY